MGKNGFDAVTKVQVPNLYVFIDTCTHKQGVVWTDVESCNWKFMTVEFQKLFSCVSEKEVNLTVVKWDCIFLEVGEVTCWSDFFIKVLRGDFFQLDSFVFVITDFIDSQCIFSPK